MSKYDSLRTIANKKKRFIKNLAKCGGLREAARQTKISLARIRRWRKKYEKFNKQVLQALDDYVQVLEDEADRRGIKGVAEPVFYEGEVCGHKQKYSDGLLQFRLKALAPEKYRERTEVKTEGGDTHITVYLPENGRPDSSAAKP